MLANTTTPTIFAEPFDSTMRTHRRPFAVLTAATLPIVNTERTTSTLSTNALKLLVFAETCSTAFPALTFLLVVHTKTTAVTLLAKFSYHTVLLASKRLLCRLLVWKLQFMIVGMFRVFIHIHSGS
jgi:hypothetical protein